MSENHPLTEEQIAEHWNEAGKKRLANWNNRTGESQNVLSAFARASYDQGVKDTQQERTGWTDDQLEEALTEAASKVGRILIGGSSTDWLPSELDSLRAILTALGIDHEPPVAHPDPEEHPLIIDNTDGSAWRYDGGKYRAPAFGFTVPVTWRNPESFTDWYPAKVVADND